MFIQKNKLYINKNSLNRKYLSDNRYEKPIEKVNLQIDKTEGENKIVINDYFGYFLFLSFMSIWLGNFSRQKLYNIINSGNKKNKKNKQKQ